METAPSGRDPRHQDVFCPVLGALVANGELKPDEAGRVTVSGVSRAMRAAGTTVPFRSALAGTSPTANKARDILRNVLTLSFDIFALRGGLVAHKGDSGILNSGTFDEAAFQAFVSHSEDGTTMTVADLARASTDNGLRDGRRGANIRARANLAAILLALGWVDGQGVRRISIATLRELYQQKKLNFPHGVPPKTGLGGLFRVLLEMARSTP
jgi:hypothetical protein